MARLFLGEVLEDLSQAECEAALKKREDMLALMIGSLYTDILRSEIVSLRSRVADLEKAARK